MKNIFLIAIVFFSIQCFAQISAPNRNEIYCNPLDLDYGWGIFQTTMSRSSADPVIVLFKEKYYLFSTLDIGGYRVSDDLIHWKNVFFNPEIRPYALNNGSYVAPGVAADDKYMYFVKLNRNREEKTVEIIRSADPESGIWEVASEIKRVSDPSIFIDRGRYFIFHGLGPEQSIKVFELDPVTLQEIQGSERLLLDYVTDVNDYKGGYHLGRREIVDEIDTRAWKGKFKRLPSTEGAWIINHDGRYYLQFATNGTLSIWYCDVVMESNEPDRNFIEQPYNPVSLKVGGFIGGAGHSSVFEDKFGNWWQITTMWVGNREPFERRLGLFPVTFDEKGRMKVHTLFGDYPMLLPQRKFDFEKEGFHAGWWNLSTGKKCKASSVLENHVPELASDENVRTWWSAQTGNVGEWFEMDLGSKKNISALQFNFAEQSIDTTSINTEDYTAYIVWTSLDGEKWTERIDKSKNTRVNPHEFIVLEQPVDARFVKVENFHAMDKGCFAIRDLRIFGHGYGSAPPEVKNVEITRDREDERFALIKWTPVKNADGYVIRFGYAPDFLNLNIQVKGGEQKELMTHILIKGQPYYFRVGANNENGYTEGKLTKDVVGQYPLS